MTTANTHNHTEIEAEASEKPVDISADEADEDSFKKMFEASLKEQATLRPGEMVKGVVVSVDQESVIVDIGAKAEAAIPTSEFLKTGDDLPEVGSELEALVVKSPNGFGVSLSVLEARQQALWDKIQKAFESGETITAKVVEENKGGYRVELGGLRAFMPRSEVDPGGRIAAQDLIGSDCEVAVMEVTRKPDNIVVSRKKPLDAEHDKKREAFFSKTSVGQKVEGTVRRLTDFGAFVDIGGVDALLHVSDMAWRRIEHPGEMLTVGQKIAAQIIKLNAETGKVSISMKALQADPWESVASIYEVGMRVTGTVRRLLDFGAVVELEAGIEGMIHRSEMSWTRPDVKPSQVLSEGDVVDVVVLAVEPKERRIKLSLKEVSENPWQLWLASHPVGTKVKGPVKNITDFGFFVGLEDDLDGLVHIGAISWEQPGEEAIKAYSKGQEVECVVLGVDIDRQRISLGIKQLNDDPFETFLAGAPRGSAVKGTIAEVKAGLVIVDIASGIQAKLPMREWPRESDAPKVGDAVEGKIIEVEKKRRQVTISVRQLMHDEERDAVRSYSQSQQAKSEPSALALELQRKLLGKAEKNRKDG